MSSKQRKHSDPNQEEEDDEEPDEQYEDVHLHRKNNHAAIAVASLGEEATKTPLSGVRLDKNSAEYVNGHIHEQRQYDEQDRTWVGCFYRIVRQCIFWFLMYILPLLNYFCVGFGSVLVTLQSYQDNNGDMQKAFDMGAKAALGLAVYYFFISVLFRWLRLKRSKESKADVLFVAPELLSLTDLFEILASSIIIIAMVIDCGTGTNVCKSIWNEHVI